MFITSRESAIFPDPVSCLSTQNQSRAGFQPAGFPHPPCVSGGSRCPEHISARKNLRSKRISLFYWVLWVFCRNSQRASLEGNLYIVDCTSESTISCSKRTGDV